MKLKRPLSLNQRLLLVGSFSVLLLFTPHLFKTGRAWLDQQMGTRRLATASTYVFPTRELAELDRLLQVRFAVPPTNYFGIARIGVRHELFKAIGPAELQAIEALRREKQDVVFYVASRDYIIQTQREKRGGIKEQDFGGSRLQGPIFMTQKPPLKVEATQTTWTTTYGGPYRNRTVFQTGKRPVDLPTEKQLNDSLGLMLISNSVLDYTATPDGKTYRAGDWQVASVPVRASDKSCIDCHYRFSVPASRLGDPLGIALYAFRSAQQKQAKTITVPLPLVPTPTPVPMPTPVPTVTPGG